RSRWTCSCSRRSTWRAAATATTDSSARSWRRASSCMTPRTREWLRKAESDRRVARKVIHFRPPEYDVACFHCQQAVEKYLKGLLNERGLPVPKTHDLLDLTDRLLPTDPDV